MPNVPPSPEAPEQWNDEADSAWLSEFIGKSIPDDAVVEGFISLISFVRPDGTLDYRMYNTLNKPTSSVVGLLEMAKYNLMVEASNHNSGDEDGE